MNMEDPIEIKLKGLFRRHPNLSKKSKNTPRGKIERVVHCQNWQFLENCQKSTLIKFAFFPKGPMFLLETCF